MDPVTRIAEDEFGYFSEFLHDEELARRIVEADVRTAVSLLVPKNIIIAIVLWRQRTGDDLKTSMIAVDAIADAVKRGEEIALD